jgi:hypothetical protein
MNISGNTLARFSVLAAVVTIKFRFSMMQETKYLKCLEALYNLDGAVVASVHLENTVIIILESMVIQKAQF